MTFMENRWLEQCRAGDTFAIERLLQTYQQDVYRLALSILDSPDDADDATQETFLSALRALDSFRGNASFKTWLFSIAINLCRSRLRRLRSRKKGIAILQNLYLLRTPEHPEETALQNEADTNLWGAVRALDEKHRIPVILRYYHDMQVTEIAEVLSVPIGTVHSRLNHAREKLRNLLEEKQP